MNNPRRVARLAAASAVVAGGVALVGAGAASASTGSGNSGGITRVIDVAAGEPCADRGQLPVPQVGITVVKAELTCGHNSANDYFAETVATANKAFPSDIGILLISHIEAGSGVVDSKLVWSNGTNTITVGGVAMNQQGSCRGQVDVHVVQKTGQVDNNGQPKFVKLATPVGTIFHLPGCDQHPTTTAVVTTTSSSTTVVVSTTAPHSPTTTSKVSPTSTAKVTTTVPGTLPQTGSGHGGSYLGVGVLFIATGLGALGLARRDTPDAGARS